MRVEFFENKIYDTISAEKRLMLVEEYEKEANDPETSEALKNILALRYTAKTVKGKTEYIDNFMKIWVDIAYYAVDNYSERKIKKIRDKYIKDFSGNEIVKLRNLSDLYRQLLYCEFRHLCRVYIYSCTESKSYSRYFDLIPIKQSKLYGMIDFDLERIGITFAGRYGFDEFLPEFIMATEDERDAFQEMAEKKSIF